jgi:adenylate kinase
MQAVYVVFFGPPGCGKGTQAKRLAEELGLVQVSTGELFRKHLGEKTPLGIKAQEFMSLGALVPDEITIGMVRERLQQPDMKAGAIFDGFPRTRAQAEALDQLLKELGSQLHLVVDFALPMDISRQRLMGRQEGRPDDKPEVIEKRLNDHAAVEASVMPYYRGHQGLVKSVDANRTVDVINRDVSTLIRAAMAG